MTPERERAICALGDQLDGLDGEDLLGIILDEQALNAELLAALRAVHAPYRTLTEEALEAGILMEFGPPKPGRGAAQLLVRSAIAKAEARK